MPNYVRVKLPDGTIKILDKSSTGGQEIINSQRPPREQVPEMWTECTISYRGFSAALRSRMFNNQKKVQLLYNGNWIDLDTTTEPNLTNLIIKFYNDNIAVKP